MRGSFIMNMRVESESTERFHGLIQDVRVKDDFLYAFVLTEGGLFQKAAYFQINPGDYRTDYNSLKLKDNVEIIHEKSKVFKEKILKETHSLYNLMMYDVDNRKIGKIRDVTVGQNHQVLEYEVSKSFFEDLNVGFSLIPADKVKYRDVKLHYDLRVEDIPLTGREGGIVNRLWE